MYNTRVVNINGFKSYYEDMKPSKPRIRVRSGSERFFAWVRSLVPKK